MRFILIFLILFFSHFVLLYPQVQPVESPQATLVGTRVKSLGGNIVSLYRDVNSVFLNPAALSSIEFLQIGLNTQTALGYFENNAFHIAYPYWGFVWGLSYGQNMLNGIPTTEIIPSAGTQGTIYPIGSYSSGWRILSFISRSRFLY